MNNLAQVESLIFVAGDEGISIEEIAAATGFDMPALKNLLVELRDKLQQDNGTSIQLIENDKVYRLITKPEFAHVLSNYYQSSVNNKLSNAGLEALTIIAYKQPVTRVEVDKIRGVNSSGSISKLSALGLIEEVGRKQEMGRPVLYGTTNYFLNYFDLDSIEDLPELPDVSEILSGQPQVGEQVELFANRTDNITLEEMQSVASQLSENMEENLEVEDSSEENE
ncbi:MAG: SMC-Scp complex subunit ScpB [Lactobacillaceae bacterium]|jgi:segregation and condensation protein B|nr:SMC-Scp complex subunit ScpB [Lactobacillaceae bacterium]